MARAGYAWTKHGVFSSLSFACGEGLHAAPAGGGFETHAWPCRGNFIPGLYFGHFRHSVFWSFLPSFHSSALKPALLSACVFTSSLVTLEPFPSSYPDGGSLKPSSNGCICWAATAVGPKRGLGIQCWAAGWCSGFLGQVSSFVPFVLFSFPLPHSFY